MTTPRLTRRAAAPPVPVTPVVPPVRRRPNLTGLIRVTYTDDDGRRFTVLVPPGRETDAAMGVTVGPPDLGGLGLPGPVALRLHNELQARGLLTEADAKRRLGELYAALQAAYRTDVAALLTIYAAQEGDGNDDQANAAK